jgi:hypothetical protein
MMETTSENLNGESFQVLKYLDGEKENVTLLYFKTLKISVCLDLKKDKNVVVRKISSLPPEKV